MGLTPRADELIHDVKQCLRREVPELRDEPDIAQMTAENVAEHVVAIFFGVEHDIEPRRIEPPAADAERASAGSAREAGHSDAARFPARAGPRPRPAARRAITAHQRCRTDQRGDTQADRTGDEYMDRTSETGVLAFQDERDRQVQWRLSVVNEASVRVGTTLDIARTAQELADLATERFADAVTIAPSTRLPETSLPRRAHSWSAGSPSGR
ncbi:hypothetical protein ACFXKC_44205 [Streptomyces sp. NPDC059340]|uniref:hypothetical protein n=1 Tax=Streptomyces sp. NPDC059340 TaxID=3346806 RepID=UPI0036CA3962